MSADDGVTREERRMVRLLNRRGKRAFLVGKSAEVPRTKPRRWQTLTEALDELERTDPAVAAASASLDRAMDDAVSRGALHRFRPLPSDRCPGCPACESAVGGLGEQR